MIRYWKTAYMAATEKTNGGLFYLLPDIFLKVATLVPLLFLWRVVMSTGVEVGMTPDQMLSYTLINAVLGSLLVVRTAATGWMSEGVLMKLFGRPLPVLGQLAAQTIGGWVPMLLMFSLPVLVAAPFLGIDIVPKSPWFFVSLILCVSLGFALETLFACLSIYLRNMNWLMDRIRAAIIALFSGTVIPIRLLPFGLDVVMKYQPFAALGGAPLSIFVGAADVTETILLQLMWNVVLWPVALLVFRASRERMVSYGG